MALHMACACGSPVSIVSFLYEKYQDAAKHASSGGMLPLHLLALCNMTSNSDVACHDVSALTFLLAAYPQAIEVKDSKGLTALDYASRSGHANADIMVRE